MVKKYFGGTLPAEQEADEALDGELLSMASALHEKYAAEMDAFQPQNAIGEVFKVLSRANKYIDENAPWLLIKDETKKARLARVLYNLVESIRICAGLLTPFMPETCAEIARRVGAPETVWDDLCTFGVLPADVTVCTGDALFPRIDMNKELAALEEISAAQKAAKAAAEGAAPAADPILPKVKIDEFAKCDLRVCEILSCEKVANSDKLLKFLLNDGSGTPRQILSGMQAFYPEPEKLVGKKVIAILNLPARKMAGQESNGMLLCAEGDPEHVWLCLVDDQVPAGSRIS